MNDVRECYACIHHDICYFRIKVDDFLHERLNPYNWVTSDESARAMITTQRSITRHCEHFEENKENK